MIDNSRPNGDYQILHDNGSIYCLIGKGLLADCIRSSLESRDVEHVSFEYVRSQDANWIGQRQFLVGTSAVKFKQEVVEYLDKYHAHYFSVIGKINSISSKTRIGGGTFINMFNNLLHDTIIGDHCVITTHCQISHNVVVGDFSHISPYSYLNNVKLGKGTVIGLRTTTTNKSQIEIADYCNFMLNSIITDNITQSGTYFGDKKTSSQSSIEHRIL